jgi:hypothetical protein
MTAQTYPPVDADVAIDRLALSEADLLTALIETRATLAAFRDTVHAALDCLRLADVQHRRDAAHLRYLQRERQRFTAAVVRGGLA